MRTSYSALNTYKTCPLKYKFQEIDRVRVPKGKEAIFGTAVHSALKFMFTKTPLYPTPDEVVNFFSQKWGESAQKAKLDGKTAAALFKDGVDMIKKFYAKNPPWNFGIVDMESRFEVPLPDPSGENHTLAGIIDRIDKIDDENYEIIDYKTARKMPSQDTLDRDLQMSIYHLGLVRRWPHLEKKTVKLSLYFLAHNEKISTARDNMSLEHTKNAVLETIKEISKRASNNDFPPEPGPLCGWCGYQSMCPMWKHLYSNQKSKIKNQNDLEPIVREYFDIKKDVEEKSARVKFLQGVLHEFMNENGVERVFGNEGYITRNIKIKPVYNLKKAVPVLREMGRLQEVVKVDETKLAKLTASLSPSWREKLNREALEGEKQTKTLIISRKKIIKTES